jgi:hypothetical protein
MHIVIELEPGLQILDETTSPSMAQIDVDDMFQGLLELGATPVGVLIAGVDALWNRSAYARVYRWSDGPGEDDLFPGQRPLDAQVLAAGYTQRDIYLAGIRALSPGCEQRPPDPKMWRNTKGYSLEDAQHRQVTICDHCAEQDIAKRRRAQLPGEPIALSSRGEIKSRYDVIGGDDD